MRNITLFAEGDDTRRPMSPNSMWISAFFYPQGLLAAISQNYARKYRVSIDSLAFKYEVQNQLADFVVDDMDASLFTASNNLVPASTTSTVGDDGVLICGFFMDGGKWDRVNSIILDSHKRFTPLPHFLCKLIRKDVEQQQQQQTGNSEVESSNVYACPVYKNSVRAGSSNEQAKNFVTEIELKCRQSSEFWILRGLAIILQDDD